MAAPAQPQAPSRPAPPRRPRSPQPLIAAPDGEETPPPPLKRRILLWITSAAATGYGLSLIIHGMILAIMGLWMLPVILENTDITTVVQSEAEAVHWFGKSAPAR